MVFISFFCGLTGCVQNGILAYCTVYTLPRLFKTSMWQFSKLNCQVNNKNVDFLKFRFVSKFLILNVHEIWIQIYFNISKYIKMHLVLLCFSGNKVKHNALWVQWSYTAHFDKCRSSRYSMPTFAQYIYCILQKTVREKACYSEHSHNLRTWDFTETRNGTEQEISQNYDRGSVVLSCSVLECRRRPEKYNSKALYHRICDVWMRSYWKKGFVPCNSMNLKSTENKNMFA